MVVNGKWQDGANGIIRSLSSITETGYAVPGTDMDKPLAALSFAIKAGCG